MFPPSVIQQLLERFYQGPLKKTDQAFVIRCPWHSDSDPSCNIYSKSGVFFCWNCHFGKNKGVGPVEGFKALGVPESELARYQHEGELETFEFKPQKFFLEELEKTFELPVEAVDEQQLLSREPWPQYWGWREIRSSTLESLQVQARFNPELCCLSTKVGPERLPRIGLTLANTRGGPNQVFLRLSSEQVPKAVNAKGLNLKREDLMPLGFPSALRSSASWPEALILVEGPYDALRTYQHLQDLELGGKVEVGAILGTGQWGHAWRQKFLVDYLPRFQGTLVLAFDADVAGFDVTKQVIADLGLYLPKDKLKILYWGSETRAKDPGDLSLAEFTHAWERLENL